MTRSSILTIGAFVVSQITWSPAVWAQTAPRHVWSHGTTLDISAGAATASSAETRGTLGAAFGWEIDHRVSLEGTGTWIAAKQTDEAFAAELKALVNLTRPNRVVPFVGAGVGLYRATFDPTRGALPAFYQRHHTSSAFTTPPTFTDPSLVLTAGVNIFTGQHVSIRPDLSIRRVTRASDSYAVTMATVHVTYHFEVHDVIR
jgi:hypothetical protein